MNKKPASLDAVNAFALLSRAKGYVHHKQYEKALADLDEALKLNPRLADILMVRASVRVDMGDFQQALADVERRMQIEPPEPMILLTRGNLRAQLGDVEPALSDFTEFLRQHPAHVLALRARALSYSRLHRFDEALADLNEALRVDPTSADAYFDRGRVYQDKVCYEAGAADYKKAIELGPKESRFYNQYAWMLCACTQGPYRNGAKAVELARRGCELTNWQNANILDTLASAYAECGQFDEAVKWAEKALDLADAELEDALTKHLEMFRNGQPARFEERK